MIDGAVVTPGSGLALVRGPFTIVAAAESEQFRRDIWVASGGASIDAVLAAMLTDGRPGVTTFGIVHDEGERHRIFLRGAVRVEVATASDVHVFEGAELRTWSEHVVDGVVSITARLTGEAGHDESFDQFVESGLVGAVACSRPAPEASTNDADNADEQEAGVLDDSGRSTSSEREQVVVERSGDADGDSGDSERSASGEGAAQPIDEHLNDDTGSSESDETAVDSSASAPAGTERSSPHLVSQVPAADAPIDPSTASDDSADDTDADIGNSESSPDDYAHMFGDTRHRSVLDAAVDDPATGPEAESLDPADPPPSESPRPLDATWSSHGLDADTASSGSEVVLNDEPMGDHDGNTLSVAEARRLRSERGGEVPIAAPASAAGTATVQALVCEQGHPNPPYDAACRRCGAELSGSPVIVPRPVLGRLRFSTGDEVVLDRPLIIGRKPDAEGRRFSDIPKQVRLDVNELSRSHAVVHLEGWQVRVEDLGSLNHTTVTLHGRQPQRLREGEPMLITDRAVIDLGGEVECVYDANP